MEFPFAFFTLLLILLFASTSDARKELAKYQKGSVTKDQPIPQAIQHPNTELSLSNEKTNCHSSKEAGTNSQLAKDFDHSHGKRWAEDFEPRPNVSANDNGVEPDDSNEKAWAKDFEPTPNLSIYDNGIEPLRRTHFVKDFEPRPSATAYEPLRKTHFVKDFEPRPSATAYEPLRKTHFVKDF